MFREVLLAVLGAALGVVLAVVIVFVGVPVVVFGVLCIQQKRRQ